MTHFFVGEYFQKEKFALNRMNQFLVIAESDKFIDGRKGKSLLSGTYSKEEFAQKASNELSTFIVLIRIDLEAIKERVNAFIYQAK